MSRPGTEFTCLHGLRGLLALLVVFYHTSTSVAPAQSILAVDVFFIMSGFILMHTHQADFVFISGRSLFRFMALRFWRTFPVHLVTIGVALLTVILVFNSWPGFEEIGYSLLAFDTWSYPPQNKSINTPIWSLHVEWVGYLLFPIICWALLRIKKGTRVFLLAALIVAAETLQMILLGAPDMDVYMGVGAFVRMLGGFSLGCVLWLIYQGKASRDIAGDTVMAAVVVGIIAILWLFDAVYSLALLSVSVLAATRPGPITQAILNSAFCRFLGRISFALYLVHYPIVQSFIALQDSVEKDAPRILFSAGAFIVSIMLSTLICISVEEPARRFGRKLTNNLTINHKPVAARI